MEIVIRLVMLCEHHQVRGHEHVETRFFKGLGFTVLYKVVKFFFLIFRFGNNIKISRFENGVELEICKWRKS